MSLDTRNIGRAIQTLLEDNGNLHETLYIQGDLGDVANVDITLKEHIHDNTKSKTTYDIKINGREFIMQLTEGI